MEPEVYVDEDRALGFHIWVAELELLVGTARGRDVDQVNLGRKCSKMLNTRGSFWMAQAQTIS